MDEKTFQTIAVGDIITSTLAADQRPTNPQRTYKGVVTGIVHKAQSVIVTLLDEGYEGLSEPVGRSQIQQIVARRPQGTWAHHLTGFHSTKWPGHQGRDI